MLFAVNVSDAKILKQGKRGKLLTEVLSVFIKRINNLRHSLENWQNLLTFASKYHGMRQYRGFTYTPTPKTAWDSLSMLEKSEMMKVAVRNGITDLKTIREQYNEFAEGGYLDWKERASKYKHLDIDNDLFCSTI